MRTEKQLINTEYLDRLNGSPFFIVVDYSGLKVSPITELRKRLGSVEAEMHVVKNSLFRLAAQEAGVGDLGSLLGGQLAVVTGKRDIAGAAKIIKNFHAEFEKPNFRFGYMDNQRLDQKEIMTLADLPPLETLRAQLIGLINTPATRLVRVIRTPAVQLAQVIKAKAEKA
jgi:large subunit ribosomal protein L10